MDELQRQQPEAQVAPSPQQQEQHAVEVQHLQGQVQRLQEESASYRCAAHRQLTTLGNTCCAGLLPMPIWMSLLVNFPCVAAISHGWTELPCIIRSMVRADFLSQ